MAKYLYGYHEERGFADLYVTDRDGKTVWEAHYPSFYESNGEMMEETTIFEDGFMKDASDLEGLESYLKSISVINKGDELVDVDSDDDDDADDSGWDYSYKKAFDAEYAAGGTIEAKIKKRLKNAFELPIQIAVYVPSTRDKDIIITKREMEARVEDVQRFLANAFGGFSAVKVEGGFESSDKGLIQEDAVRVVAFASKENENGVPFEQSFESLMNQVKNWCSKWSQQSIGVEFENDLFYVDTETKFADGGLTWYKYDNNIYESRLGDFDIMIYPETQRGYWSVYVLEGKNKVGAEFDIYGIKNAKDKAYSIIKGQYMADGGMMARGGKTYEYETYHDTLASALNEADKYVESKGLKFTDETYFPDVTMGGISYGQTARLTRGIQREGKKKEDVLIVVIYRMDSGKYELTMYTSYEKGGYMADGGEVRFVDKFSYKDGIEILTENLEDGRVFYKAQVVMYPLYRTIAPHKDKDFVIQRAKKVQSDMALNIGLRMEDGGEVASKKEMLDYLKMYFRYYSELRTIAEEENGILTKRMLPTLDDEQIEMAYEDAKYELDTIVKYENYADGGSIAEGNAQMLRSNAKAIKHHAEELEDELEENPEVEAWVVAKGERAATDLSDITHYLDGRKFSHGGDIEHGVDLFEDYEDMPVKVLKVLGKYDLESGDYRELEKALKDLNSIGYTFEYELDGEPYDLRKIGQKGKSEFYAKGGSIKSLEKRVAEVNELIKRGNDLGIEVVDESTTWQAPMKYKPLKYTNGVLYISYEVLDLYNYSKTYSRDWEKKSYKIGKYESRNIYGYQGEAGAAQREALTEIARMYRKPLKSYDTYGYFEDGGEVNKVNPEEMKAKIEDILNKVVPSFYKGVSIHKNIFDTGNNIRIFIAASDYKINNVAGQLPQVVSLSLDLSDMDLHPQVFGGNGGQRIEREPNMNDPKEKYLAMKGVKVPFRTPQPNEKAVLDAIKRFAENYKKTLAENKDVLLYRDVVDYDKLLAGSQYADGGMISLSEHYKTFGKKDDLVGLRVYDKNNDEFVYIKDVDSGIWAGKNKNDESGHNYRMSDLMVEKMADGGELPLSFNQSINKFVEKLNSEYSDSYLYTVDFGKKYAKISTQPKIKGEVLSGKSTWGFIALQDDNAKGFVSGDLLKAAGFNTPAKGSRGNILNGTARYDKYSPQYGKGWRSEGGMAKGGEVMKHKHLEHVTIELLEPTSKGWKVKQIETHSIGGRKLSTPKEKVAYFSKEEIKDLFEPTMAMGGFVIKYVDSSGNEKTRTDIYGKPEIFKTESAAKFKISHVPALRDGIHKNIRIVPYMADGGVIASSETKEGIEKLISDYYYSSNISLQKVDNKDEYEVSNSKGKINGVKVVLKKGRYQFIKSDKMAMGGTFASGVKAIEKKLVGTKVKPKYQKEYGKTYDKAEAHEAASKIKGKIRAMELAKKYKKKK